MSDQSLLEMSQKMGQALTAQGLLLATAESCTGGWVSQVVTAVAGSSGWFDRGFVTYSNSAKREMLGVSAQTLDAHGAVSEATVCEMVQGALANSHAQVALAISGVAGPDGGSPDKPVGTVCFAWGIKNGEPKSLTHCFSGDREAVRHAAVHMAIMGVMRLLPVSK